MAFASRRLPVRLSLLLCTIIAPGGVSAQDPVMIPVWPPLRDMPSGWSRDEALVWSADDSLLIHHAEFSELDEHVAPRSCAHTGFYKVFVRGGTARPVFVGDEACELSSAIAGSDRGPVRSPDGEWLAFLSPTSELRVSRADGTEMRTVFYIADERLVWSPDSRWVTFTWRGLVWRVDIQTKEYVQVTATDLDER